MHDNTNPDNDRREQQASVLAILRRLMPNRHLRLSEALRVAELQADRLLRLQGIPDVPVPIEVVSALPRIDIDCDTDLPRHAASGASRWDQARRAWVISINPEEPRTRQRFTIFHEYKHIVDHYHPGLGGPLPRSLYGLEPTEYVAEFFAGCLLMPKRLVKAAYYDGIQRVSDLAELFDVSVRAMEVRLDQLGITRASDEPTTIKPRYRRQPRTRRYQIDQYRRPLSPNRPAAVSKERAA
jgi:Zn-dependent peptidase ImmA (M78 family)